MKYFDRIERFLKDEMSEDESWSFEQELLVNDELKEEFDIQRIEQALISNMSETHLLEKIESFQNLETSPKSKILRFKKWLPLSIAAMFAMAIGLNYLVNLNGSTINPQGISNKYYGDYSPNFSSMRGSDVEESSRAKMLEELDQKTHLKSVVSYFEKSENHEDLYFLAHAYYANKDYEKSVSAFRQYLNSENVSQDRTHASEFYLGLALLASNQLNSGKKQFAKLSDNKKHIYQAQSKEILNDL